MKLLTSSKLGAPSNIIIITFLTDLNVECNYVSFIIREYSSVVEHSTADREVPSSNLGASSNFLLLFILIILLC